MFSSALGYVYLYLLAGRGEERERRDEVERFCHASLLYFWRREESSRQTVKEMRSSLSSWRQASLAAMHCHCLPCYNLLHLGAAFLVEMWSIRYASQSSWRSCWWSMGWHTGCHGVQLNFGKLKISLCCHANTRSNNCCLAVPAIMFALWTFHLFLWMILMPSKELWNSKLLNLVALAIDVQNF